MYIDHSSGTAPDTAPRHERPYAWYVRVPDRPGFLRHVAPVLEQRIAESPLNDSADERRLDFFRSGLKLGFTNGGLTTAETWQRPVFGGAAAAGVPPLVFLQLVFGRRSRA